MIWKHFVTRCERTSGIMTLFLAWLRLTRHRDTVATRNNNPELWPTSRQELCVVEGLVTQTSQLRRKWADPIRRHAEEGDQPHSLRCGSAESFTVYVVTSQSRPITGPISFSWDMWSQSEAPHVKCWPAKSSSPLPSKLSPSCDSAISRSTLFCIFPPSTLKCVCFLEPQGNDKCHLCVFLKYRITFMQHRRLK